MRVIEPTRLLPLFAPALTNPHRECNIQRLDGIRLFAKQRVLAQNLLFQEQGLARRGKALPADTV